MRFDRIGFVLGLLLVLALAGGCGDDESPGGTAPAARSHPLLGEAPERVLAAGDTGPGTPDASSGSGGLTVDYPLDGAVFPPGFVPPTFLWHDTAEASDTWQVEVGAQGEDGLRVLVPGAPPPQGAIDPEAIGDTNEVYVPTPYQASAISWTPSESVWGRIQRRSRATPTVIAITGFSASDPSKPLSRGSVTIETSLDEVGAPIFYRDVPLMPAVGEEGRIRPLGPKAIPLIQWRLRDVSRRESRTVLTGMPSCANCHSFSRDGTTLGMDVDGPDGDKGTYAIAAIEKTITIDAGDVLTWNSFPDKPEDHKTIGFLSQVSPSGRYVVSTVNESLYVANFKNHAFLQVFFPTRGILAWYSRETRTIRALPGADDPAYVHCDPAWTPNGKAIVFARAEAFDPYVPGKPLAAYPNDENEPQIRYDLYRMPFDRGRGGTPVAIEGASDNGMSNTFPKVSPDGRWVVFTKCANGQLMRPDGRLWIVPLEGGAAREMRCNTKTMNSWHSFSPNGRWMVFSSKVNTPYTQMFLTHIDADGDDTPPILIPNATAANRAVNIPEFLNAPYDALVEIEVPIVRHFTHFQRGDGLALEGRFRDAIPHLEAAVEADPTFARAHAALADSWAELGKLEKAEAHYRRAIQHSPSAAFYRTNLGMILLSLERIDEAVEQLRAALTVNPNDQAAHNNLGMAFGQLDRLEDATRHFERALALDPGFARARKNLGTIWIQRGRGDRALEEFEKVLDLEPEDPYTLSAITRLLGELGRSADALPYLKVLVRVRRDDVQARARLAWLLATSPDDRVRDGVAAVKHATVAARGTAYRDATVLDALAAAYAESGRFEEAAITAARALEILKDSDPTRAHSVRARMRRYRQGKTYREAR